MTDEFESLLSKFEDSKMKEPVNEEERPTVLVVDDDESMRRSVQRILSHKFNMLIASNGPEGIRLFEENDVDSVVLDVKMPIMSGFEFCKRIRTSDRPHVPILFLTAHQDEHDLQEVLNQFHPFAYLDKGGKYDLADSVAAAVQTYQSVKKDIHKKSEDRKNVVPVALNRRGKASGNIPWS